MGMTGQRSAIVAPIRLPAALEAIRQEHVDNAHLGVPAHVTLLFPFVAPTSIDAAVLDRARAALARTHAFEAAFTEVRFWPPDPTAEGVVWLPPTPAGPFIEMTKALVEAFPGNLPYGGLHDEVIPHLTLANVSVDATAIEADARRHLPFERRVTHAVLLVESAEGRWRTARRLPLGVG
jgi:2'-5' RNA ligase